MSSASATDAASRYRAYLASAGIVEPGDRAVELNELAAGPVRFFAWAGGGGLRWKAAATAAGLVTPGWHAGDAWHGFLAGIGDAAAAARRIAWLETDESDPPHGLPPEPVLAADPAVPPPAHVDPSSWVRVTAPTLATGPDGEMTLVAWLLPSGIAIPQRWTIAARPGAPAEIRCVSAREPA